MRLKPRLGTPSPDDLDAMLARVWKSPSFFLLHPRALEAFLRECTWRGVPPPTVQMNGATFVTWRGVLLVPTEKLEVNGRTLSRSGPGKTNIILVRAGGEREHGVAGLHQTGIPGEMAPSLSARLMGIDHSAVASYLMTLYFSLAIHAEDAVCVLDDVEVGFHHDYSVREPAAKPAEPAVPAKPAEPPASPKHTPPTWHSLGGGLTDFVAGTQADGRTIAAVHGTDHGLWINSQGGAPDAAWTGWQALGGTIRGRPAIAPHADGRLFCCVIGTDDGLWFRQQTAPNSADWENYAHQPSPPLAEIVAVQGGDGRIEVLARGKDDHLWRLQQGGKNGDEFIDWQDLGGSLGGAPVVVRRGDGCLEVFARGKDGTLASIAQAGAGSRGWNAWRSLAGSIAEDPTLARDAGGRLHVFARGADEALWTIAQTAAGGPWGPWSSLGKEGVGSVHAPVAAVDAAGVVHVFARGADAAIWHREQVAPGASFRGWHSLAGATRMHALHGGGDRPIEVLAIGSDGSLWHFRERAPGQAWA